MKPPKHFVKAVGCNLAGLIKKQILLTPPMEKDEAERYLDFITGDSAIKLRWALEMDISKDAKTMDDVVSIHYMVAETTLYK